MSGILDRLFHSRREARAKFDAAVERLASNEASPLTAKLDGVIERLEQQNRAMRSSAPPPFIGEDEENATPADTNSEK